MVAKSRPDTTKVRCRNSIQRIRGTSKGSAGSVRVMKARKSDVLTELKSNGKLEGDLEKRLRDALTEFAKQFSVEEKK